MGQDASVPASGPDEDGDWPVSQLPRMILLIEALPSGPTARLGGLRGALRSRSGSPCRPSRLQMDLPDVLDAGMPTRSLPSRSRLKLPRSSGTTSLTVSDSTALPDRTRSSTGLTPSEASSGRVEVECDPLEVLRRRHKASIDFIRASRKLDGSAEGRIPGSMQIEDLDLMDLSQSGWTYEHDELFAVVLLDDTVAPGGHVGHFPSSPIEIWPRTPESEVRIKFFSGVRPIGFRSGMADFRGLSPRAELTASMFQLIRFGAPLFASLWLGLEELSAGGAVDIMSAVQRADAPELPKVKLTLFKPTNEPFSQVSQETVTPDVKGALGNRSAAVRPATGCVGWHPEHLSGVSGESVAQVQGVIRCLNESNDMVRRLQERLASTTHLQAQKMSGIGCMNELLAKKSWDSQRKKQQAEMSAMMDTVETLSQQHGALSLKTQIATVQLRRLREHWSRSAVANVQAMGFLAWRSSLQQSREVRAVAACDASSRVRSALHASSLEPWREVLEQCLEGECRRAGGKPTCLVAGLCTDRDEHLLGKFFALWRGHRAEAVLYQTQTAFAKSAVPPRAADLYHAQRFALLHTCLRSWRELLEQELKEALDAVADLRQAQLDRAMSSWEKREDRALRAKFFTRWVGIARAGIALLPGAVTLLTRVFDAWAGLRSQALEKDTLDNAMKAEAEHHARDKEYLRTTLEALHKENMDKALQKAKELHAKEMESLRTALQALHNKDLDEAREITERHAREMELLQITAEALQEKSDEDAKLLMEEHASEVESLQYALEALLKRSDDDARQARELHAREVESLVHNHQALQKTRDDDAKQAMKLHAREVESLQHNLEALRKGNLEETELHDKEVTSLQITLEAMRTKCLEETMRHTRAEASLQVKLEALRKENLEETKLHDKEVISLQVTMEALQQRSADSLVQITENHAREMDALQTTLEVLQRRCLDDAKHTKEQAKETESLHCAVEAAQREARQANVAQTEATTRAAKAMAELMITKASLERAQREAEEALRANQVPEIELQRVQRECSSTVAAVKQDCEQAMSEAAEKARRDLTRAQQSASLWHTRYEQILASGRNGGGHRQN